jgi:hypothetical protein
MEEPTASIFWVEKKIGREESVTGIGRWRSQTGALGYLTHPYINTTTFAIILYFHPEDGGSNSSKIVEKFDQTTACSIPEVIIIVTAMRKSNHKFFNMGNVQSGKVESDHAYI